MPYPCFPKRGGAGLHGTPRRIDIIDQEYRIRYAGKPSPLPLRERERIFHVPAAPFIIQFLLRLRIPGPDQQRNIRDPGKLLYPFSKKRRLIVSSCRQSFFVKRNRDQIIRTVPPQEALRKPDGLLRVKDYIFSSSSELESGD